MAKSKKKRQEKSSLIELCEPQYLDRSIAKEVKAAFPTMRRFNANGSRFYFLIDHNMDAVFFPSVTSVLDKVMPKGYGYEKLLKEHGKDFDVWLNRKADYGSFLHQEVGLYLRFGEYDFDTTVQRRKSFADFFKLDYDTSSWDYTIKKDIASIIQFCIDHDVKVLAMEQIVYYNDGYRRYAGAVDMYCDMNIQEEGYFGEVYKTGERKGEPKKSKQTRRVRAIVDFKSGKNGFLPKYESQLKLYQLAMEQHGFKVDCIFNVAPKDWDSSPTYTLKEQSNGEYASLAQDYLSLYFKLYSPNPAPFIYINGKAGGNDLSACISTLSPREYVLHNLGMVDVRQTNSIPTNDDIMAEAVQAMIETNNPISADVPSATNTEARHFQHELPLTGE